MFVSLVLSCADENKLLDYVNPVVFPPPSEADQRSHNEGEHENWKPSCQHEEEPCASDHSV